MSVANSQLKLSRKERIQTVTLEDLNPNITEIQPQEATLKSKLTCCGPFQSHKELGLLIFIITITVNILNSSEVFYIFNNQLIDVNINIAFLATCALRIVFFLIISIRLIPFKKFLHMVILFDPISIPMILSIYAYCMFIVFVFQDLTILDYASMVMMTLLFVFYAAFHRVLITQIMWRKWQLIIYKVSIGIAVGVYAIWGIYFIFPGVEWTNGQDPKLDSSVKEFVIFYVIASAQFLVKILQNICEVDKTADLYLDENECSSIIKYNK